MTDILPKFQTLAEGEALGWIPAHAHLIERLGPPIPDGPDHTYKLQVIDVSDPGEIRSRFAIVIRHAMEPLRSRVLAYSHVVKLSEELNQLKRPGCFVRMFHSQEWNQALAEARKIAENGILLPEPELTGPDWHYMDLDRLEK